MTVTTDEPDLTGLVLDERYELVRLIGVGGMGSVYEARHVRIAKSVAVKVLNREFAYKESFRRRFLREAQAASLIRHKNVVAIHDFGDHDDVAYIVMELLEGRDLHVLIHERAPLPWAEAREILLQTAAALGAAHERGVIHRDVKPANVFVADDPHDGMVVKVLDFGIARASTMADGGAEGATGSSRVFGTPTYMAPEIAFGEPADGRSDLYSLGVVAYRVLTGQLPFDGDVPYLVISKHANEPPPPLRRIEPSVPLGVEQVVLKALAKRPGDRFQSMASFARALASIDAAGRGEVPPSLLLETEATGVGPRTESVARAGRGRGRSAEAAGERPIPPENTVFNAVMDASASGARTAIVRAGDERDGSSASEPGSARDSHSGSRRAVSSESSDVGTPVTDLGTERLPSRRRITGVSDLVDLDRTGFTERASEGDLSRSSDELEPRSGPSGPKWVRIASPTPSPTPTPTPAEPTARPWSGFVRVLGLLALVAVAAAVGAIVARTQEPVASTEGAVASGVEPGMRAAEGAEVGGSKAAPEASTSKPTAGAGDAASPAAPSDAGSGAPSDAGNVAPNDAGNAAPSDAAVPSTDPAANGAAGTTTAETEPSPSSTTTTTPSPTARPTTRKPPTDASVKKKLARELQRACGAGAAGAQVTIEGFITAEGQVTGARVLDAPGDARGCIKRVVEAQRFPPGELRTLDLSVSL